MCAINATPPPPPATPKPLIKNGKTFWKTNQNGRNHLACMCIILQKNPSIMKVIIFTLGYNARYAPRTPEIAPEAPTAGIELSGSIAT